MREFRKKQKKLFNIMKAIIIFAAVYIVAFIGLQPYIAQYSTVADSICRYIADITVVALLVVVFTYYTKYGKSDSFLNIVEHEISDNGFYYSSRDENNSSDYSDAVLNDLKECRFNIENNVEINEFDFAFTAMKKNEFFYCAVIDDVDRNDVIAYLDCVIDDLSVRRLKRTGNAVMCFISQDPQDSAIALSKAITTFGKKDSLKLATAIVNPTDSHVYFLGNMPTKCQQMIVNHIMNCELPIKDKYISKEKMPFQSDLEKHMESFNINDYKNGNFFAH